MTKLFAFFMSFFCVFSSFATELSEVKPKYCKQRVTTEELVVTNQGIFFIGHDKTIQETPGVFVDNDGLYVMVPQFWYCPDCQRNHWGACPRDY